MDQETVNVSLEDALQLLLCSTRYVLSSEIVSLNEALGRVCAQSVYAPFDLPPFDRSPLDGYAVCAASTIGARRKAPSVLNVVEELCAGMTPFTSIKSGQAARIMTGAPIPAGADCIVRQEDTDCGTKAVQIFVEHKPFQNFCSKGADVRQGACCIEQGDLLDFTRIGVLASLGITQVPVYCRPIIGLLTTGDELIDIGTPLKPGKIYNSNQHLLQARIRDLGAIPYIVSKCGDDAVSIVQAITSNFGNYDFLITTGGVSVGKKDFMPKVCDLLGDTPLFHGVSIKPGSPVMALVHNGKCILCLSGNPFAATATFELLARPVISQLHGLSNFSISRETGILQDAFSKVSYGRRFIRARINDGKVYLPKGGPETHSSGSLVSMVGCNCMIDIPEHSAALVPGQEVTVLIL